MTLQENNIIISLLTFEYIHIFAYRMGHFRLIISYHKIPLFHQDCSYNLQPMFGSLFIDPNFHWPCRKPYMHYLCSSHCLHFLSSYWAAFLSFRCSVDTVRNTFFLYDWLSFWTYHKQPSLVGSTLQAKISVNDTQHSSNLNSTLEFWLPMSCSGCAWFQYFILIYKFNVCKITTRIYSRASCNNAIYNIGPLIH